MMIAAMALTVSLAGDADKLLESVDSLDTEAQPSSIVLHPQRQMLLVSSFGGDVVQTFTLKDGCKVTKGKSYAAGRGPFSLALDPTRDLAYVAYFSENKLGLFKISGPGELKETGRFATGGGPNAVVLDPGGNRVFVSNAFDGTVTVYTRTETNRLQSQRTEKTLEQPRALTVHPSGRFLYVADEDTPTLEVFAVNGDLGRTTLRSIGKYPMRGVVEDAAVHPSLPFLFVTEGAAHQISAYRIGSDGRLSLAGQTAIQAFPQSLVIDEKGELLFVLCRHTNDIYVYAVSGGARLKRLDSFPSFEYPEDLVVTSESRCLYVIGSAYGRLHSLKVTR
jgi:6-phosphogluconolactonase